MFFCLLEEGYDEDVGGATWRSVVHIYIDIQIYMYMVMRR